MFLKYFTVFALLILCGACQSTQNEPVAPKIVPAVEVKRPVTTQHELGIIGAVEPIYFLPMKTPFQARIDTGAENSSLDVRDIRYFERDGEKWVSFILTNDDTGETHRFEKKVVRQTVIKRKHQDEKRLVVNMDVKFGNEIITAVFSLADREKFEYQALIGRNILTGRAIVDTSVSHTLN